MALVALDRIELIDEGGMEEADEALIRAWKALAAHIKKHPDMRSKSKAQVVMTITIEGTEDECHDDHDRGHRGRELAASPSRGAGQDAAGPVEGDARGPRRG